MKDLGDAILNAKADQLHELAEFLIDHMTIKTGSENGPIHATTGDVMENLILGAHSIKRTSEHLTEEI